jgi:hypothetical protein
MDRYTRSPRERMQPRVLASAGIRSPALSPMADPKHLDPPPSAAAPRQARLGDVVRAVFWSFFGVRKGRDMRADAASIRPHQVIIVGVALGAAFVLALILVVRLVLRAAGA